jgi:hypothetical protein
MLQAIEQLRKSNQLQTQSFRVRNNIPVDTRFIIQSLSTIDTELPLKYRYEGLIFFVLDQEIFDGVEVTGVGVFFCFEADLTKPVPLSEISSRFIVTFVGGFNGDYSTLFTKLNGSFPKIGSIIYIDELGICVIKTGETENDWKYAFGTYNVTTEEEFLTIPLALREPGKVVLESGTEKIILNNATRTLSNVVLVYSRKEDITLYQNYRYYLINGFLNYYIGNTLYPVGDKFIYLDSTNLQEGLNDIIHNFNTTHIIAYIRIYTLDNNNIEFDSNTWSNLDINIKDVNTITVKSHLSIDKCDIILLTKL